MRYVLGLGKIEISGSSFFIDDEAQLLNSSIKSEFLHQLIDAITSILIGN
jgi:hypothetical protein